MKKRTRYFIFIFFILFGLYFLMPTFNWYFVYSEQDKYEARLEGEKLKNEISKRVNETQEKFKEGEVLKNELAELNQKVKEEIILYNKANAEDKIKTKKSYTYNEIKDLIVQIKGKEKFSDAFFANALEEYYVDLFKQKKKVKNSIIKLGLDLQGGAYAVVNVNFNHPKIKEQYPDGVSAAEKNAMIDSAILKIENRINKWGLAEIDIKKLKEQEKIIINLPGVKEVTELRQIIETVGVLDFKIVSQEGSDVFNKIKMDADREKKVMFDENLKLLPEFQKKLEDDMVKAGKDPDVEVLFVSNKDKWGSEEDLRETLVVEKESLLGKNIKITKASVQPDQFGNNTVNFTLDTEDAKKWAKVTGDNVGKEIAIILDDVILHAPVVREKIPNGRSQITLGNAPLEELQALALILRSGSLNVPLEISEENVVGASLGKDTIEKGLYAILYGLILVLIFMIIWYSLGGIIADIAMLLNLLLLMGGLALFNATLTLPGIAGIILTIGMAVDANVIIYERIKEEFRSGKTFKTALNLGYNKAFWTIMDANLTTFAAGIGLSLFGTGPIKGFAVTLCLGIIVSLFTTLFGSRLIFDSLLSLFEFKSLRVLSFIKGK